MKAMLRVLCLAQALVYCLALNNGLGKTPGMGWNSDYCVQCSGENGFQNEAFVKHIADYIHSTDFQKLGYHYVNMDASWDLPQRDSDGNLQPDPKLWPSGLKTTVDYVHSLGLGFGLYGDRGDKDCAGNPGNLGHEDQDAKFYASMEIDWYKSDSCSATGDHDQAFQEYGRMRDALNKTGRPIWFALCGWNTWYAPVGQSLGNSWRVGPDTVCGWTCVMKNVQASLAVSNYTGPTANGGGWNDMCLLLNPGFAKGSDIMTKDRHRSQFSLWCVLAANLLMTGNLSAIDPYAIETWSNAEAIAVNQDPAGNPTIRLDQPAARELGQSYPPAHVQECGGEPDLQTWQLDVPMKGFVHNNSTNTCWNVDDCKLDLIYDGCTTTGGTCAGKGRFDNEQFTFADNGTIISYLNDENKCVTLTSTNQLVRAPCIDGGAENQTFHYDSSSGQVTTKGGQCVTAAGSSGFDNMIIGRPLQDGSWAIVFLNNENSAQNMTCGKDCLGKMFPDATSSSLVLRDLWQHKDIATVDGPFQLEVGGGGASRFVTLRSK